MHQKAGLHDTKVMQSNMAMLTIYQGKEKKNVCTLSTTNKSVVIHGDAKKDPETVSSLLQQDEGRS